MPKRKTYIMSMIRAATNEVRREMTVRKNVYPKMVSNGKLSEFEAGRRLIAMDTALAILEKLDHRPDIARQLGLLPDEPTPNARD